MIYIWYCPRPHCGSIVTKTSEPILKSGNTYVCKRCNEVIKSEVLTKCNKRNIKKYLDDIDKKVDSFVAI